MILSQISPNSQRNHPGRAVKIGTTRTRKKQARKLQQAKTKVTDPPVMRTSREHYCSVDVCTRFARHKTIVTHKVSARTSHDRWLEYGSFKMSSGGELPSPCAPQRVWPLGERPQLVLSADLCRSPPARCARASETGVWRSGGTFRIYREDRRGVGVGQIRARTQTTAFHL